MENDASAFRSTARDDECRSVGPSPSADHLRAARRRSRPRARWPAWRCSAGGRRAEWLGAWRASVSDAAQLWGREQCSSRLPDNSSAARRRRRSMCAPRAGSSSCACSRPCGRAGLARSRTRRPIRRAAASLLRAIVGESSGSPCHRRQRGVTWPWRRCLLTRATTRRPSSGSARSDTSEVSGDVERMTRAAAV